ncbi:hypothetical protein OVA29_08540 [Exiguobacterium sp. SL14]|nr:hypothetical protein [Exiguobacterium sp. SL14]MCY1690704.1 hypothetical protein [Exiguobacterium sp. SL14]
MKKLIFGSSIAVALLLSGCNESEDTTQAVEKKVVQKAPETIDWKSEVQKLADGDGSPTEKHDATYMLVKQANLSKKEIILFEKELVKDYKSGNYLSFKDDQTALMRIFKSVAIEKNTDNAAMKSFSFDFYQNVKYVYRGVESPTSEAVKSNEDQMNDALK